MEEGWTNFQKLKMKEGIYPIWKTKGPSSHDIVAKIRRISGAKKVGHAGTLDPLAKGILVVAVGREFTRKIDQIKDQEKEYQATIKLGQFSTTDDEEGEKKDILIDKKPSEKDIRKTFEKFIGQIKQQAPKFSAIKIYGKEAYKRARMGEDFPLPPRDVEIKNIVLQKYVWPTLEIKVVSGPGVYIRALARDIGKELGCGGYLADLTRTRVGNFNKMSSKKIDNFFTASKDKK